MSGDLALFQQGDVFDQERQHPLALALRGVRVAPHRGEVGGQGEDALALVVVDGDLVGGAPAVILLLCVGEGAQPGVPVGLQRIGDQSVRRIHLHVPVASVVGFVLGPLDLCSTHGTLVNRQKQTDVVITEGDAVQIGNVLLTFLDRDDVSGAETLFRDVAAAAPGRLEILYRVSRVVGALDDTDELMDRVLGATAAPPRRRCCVLSPSHRPIRRFVRCCACSRTKGTCEIRFA